MTKITLVMGAFGVVPRHVYYKNMSDPELSRIALYVSSVFSGVHLHHLPAERRFIGGYFRCDCRRCQELNGKDPVVQTEVSEQDPEAFCGCQGQITRDKPSETVLELLAFSIYVMGVHGTYLESTTTVKSLGVVWNFSLWLR